MGYSRDAVQARIDRFNLVPPYDGRDLFDLKPLNPEREGSTMTLEQARTALAITQERKAAIEVETLDKERLPVAVLNQVMGQAFSEIRATIDASALPQKAKDDICDALKDVPKRLRW